MKFLHIADLHIGKKLKGYSLLEDKKFVLNQIIEIDKQISSFKATEKDCKIIHEFWKENASSLGVNYETDFSYLI